MNFEISDLSKSSVSSSDDSRLSLPLKLKQSSAIEKKSKSLSSLRYSGRIYDAFKKFLTVKNIKFFLN